MENWDEYDIRQSGGGLYPPSTYENYLSDPAIMKAIGARGKVVRCSNAVKGNFELTWDGKVFPSIPY
jgi:carboxypeptidase D